MKTKAVHKYVTFILDKIKFGIEVLKTREIVEYGRITPMPEAPEYVNGVINLRGNVVPVVDLMNKFFQAKTKIEPATSIMIVEPLIDAEKSMMGIIVDSVTDVLEIKPDLMGKTPKYGFNLKSEYIKNVACINEEFIMILDIDHVMAHIEIKEDLSAMLQKQPA